LNENIVQQSMKCHRKVTVSTLNE